ncbi:MAG: hypothetical protein EG822_07580 [Deltaproteobacteria bacterium]|nr:hypothetical protein [Deltaproteobacteria bacterium]TLN04637.1 MAG: hypothetical protein FDZ73_02600 [bacterium]
MKLRTALIVTLMMGLILAAIPGSSMEPDTLKDQIDVFGVQLDSTVDHQEINGVKAVEEPCLRGYERSFDALDILIGYGFDGKVRKITTRNPVTSMFGIKPGMTYGEGKHKILLAGFVEQIPPFKFKATGCSITFLVDEKDRIFALKLERQE